MNAATRLAPAAEVAEVSGSDLFDAAWYLEQYPDVAILGMDPAEHYLWIGARIGRNPSPQFCTRSYLSANGDVHREGINPLIHYLRSGREENRPIYPVMSQLAKDARSLAKRIVVRRADGLDEQDAIAAGPDTGNRAYAYREDPVAVVMPTRNRAAMIGKSIRSALSQTHRNLGIIVVDDGSEDETRDIVEGIGDPRVTYIYNAGPHGVSRARNLALERAEARWVFFLDSDNIWREDMIEVMLRHAERQALSAGYCAADILDDEGNRKSVLYADFDYESLLRENFIDLNCFFMRFEGPFARFRFDESLRRLVDWDFILRIGAQTRIGGIPYIGVDYFDGEAERISKVEYTDAKQLHRTMESIRDSARQAVVEMPVIRDSASYRIAVVCHVFHPDLVEECLTYLQSIAFDHDLFITTSLPFESPAIARIRKSLPAARLLGFPNVGADLAPFLELVSTLKPYNLVCKIHTKRDAGKWGESWRRELIDSVLRSADYVEQVVELFKRHRELRMICSQALYKHGRRNSIPETLEQVEQLAKATGLAGHLEKDWAFTAGTMFWIRPESLVKMARVMADSSGYSVSFRQDGALEHGLERIIGLTLWDYPDTLVGLSDLQGGIELYPLGEGHTTEGIAQTMERIRT